MNTTFTRSVVGLVASLAAAVPTAIRAQEAEPPDSDSSESSLETIVVTGTAIAGGVKKLEASYNIVTATE